MINQVVFEGILTNTWTYADDLFLRLASYRDPDQPPKRLTEIRDAADYVNVRITKGALRALDLHSGMALRVHGLLQSREYDETLDDFLSKAKKNNNHQEGINVEITGGSPRQVSAGRNLVEILSERIIVIQPPAGSRTKPEADKKRKPETTAA